MSVSTKSRTKCTSFDLSKTSPVNIKRPKKNFSSVYSVKDRSKQKKGTTVKKNAKVIKKPFVPPPGKTSPGRPMSWESKSHRLEINPPLRSTRSRTMLIDELSTTEDEEYRDSTRKHERKISQLLNDVSLNEREYLKSKTEEHLNASRLLIEDQENEIQTYKKDLRDFPKLRRSLGMKDKEIEMIRNEAEALVHEKDSLLQKLLAVESEERQASLELDKLRDTCHKLKKDQKFSENDINTLSLQRDMLMNKLDEFELANKKLRELLRDTQQKQAASEHLSDRCDILMRKLTSSEAKIQNQTRVSEDMQATMETTRRHLQGQLRQKEAECHRMSSIVAKLEHDQVAQKVEVEQYQGLLAATRDKSVRDKEALKKATRIQRERAQRQEDDNEVLQKHVNTLLLELDNAKNTLQDLTDSHNKSKQEKEFLEEESHILRMNILDIGETLELSSKTMKSGPVHVVEKLVSKVRSLKSVKLENANLKDEIKTLEDNLHSNEFKIRSSDTEISKLQAALEQFKAVSSDYKAQLDRYRNECDDLHETRRRQEGELNSRIKQSMHEVNDVRTSLQSKILELEPYPELLKTTEIQLQEARKRAAAAEKRLNEHSHIIAELTQKVELQTEQLDHMREKYRSKHDDCKQLDQQLHAMERQIQSVDGSQRELIQSLSRKDENLSLLQEKFDAQRIENERLIQQLEVALADAKKQADSQREKSLAKERSAQARIMDLEAQLSRSTQNTQLLKRSKEEAERKFNSRLQDMRDRLEQANTTTRSMQSYVQFLKSTYANVFSDEVDIDLHKF